MQTIDQRVAELERVANTIPTAIMNVVLELLTEVGKLDSFDKDDLKARLLNLQEVDIENGNKQAYRDLISLAVSRLD